MIDINTHLLTGLYDGCKDFSDAGKVILKAKSQGVTSMIITPQEDINSNISANEIKERFKKFKQIFSKYNVELYLGAEIDYSKDCLIKVFYKSLLSMNDTKFVYMNFLNTKEEYDLYRLIREYLTHGLNIIIAHAEYLNLSEKEYMLVKNAGAYIEVDALSLFDKKHKKIVDYLLKERLIDFVSSNVKSSNDDYIMDKAYKEVIKRTSKDYADLLFLRNAKNYLMIGK